MLTSRARFDARILAATWLAALAPLLAPALGSAAETKEGRAAGVAEPERASVMLVLDASGSMWARLDGEVKMDIARQVVRGLIDSHGDRIDLGAVAYGHRRQGDCGDIETLTAPGPDSNQKLRAAVDGLSAQGKTPLASAIEQAAQDARYRDRPAVVTVVSDGRETCGLDPCAVASRLAADGVDFTVHVVGFDTTEEEGRELRCIASATGGQFARATSRAELVEALGRVLTRTVEASGPSTLELTAADAQDNPIVDGLRWTISPLDAASDATAGPVVIDGLPEPLALPSGRYDVRVEHAGTTIERHLVLRAGETWREHVRFGPGKLALRAVLSEGAVPIAEPLAWSIHAIRAFGRIADDPVHAETAATCLVGLDAGHYEIRARYGDTERRLRVEVRAGVTSPHTVDLEAGEARVFATLPPPGGPFLEPVQWTIRPFDGGGDRAEPIVERRTTNARFVLPVGRYHVTGRHGGRIGDAIVRVLGGRSEAVGIVLHGTPAPAARPGE